MATTQELLLHAKLINEVSRPLKEIKRDLTAVKTEIAAAGKPTADQAAKMRSLATETRKTVREQENLAATVQKVGRGMTMYLSVPIAAALGYSTKAASDLNEAVTKSDAVFGRSAAAVHKLGETSAQSLGLSKRAAENAAGSIGALVRPMGLSQSAAADMSISMVKLSADLASFYNESGDDALTALRSGLVGETEPLRQFGVSLSAARVQQYAYANGIAHTGDVLTAQQKAMATYAIIMQDTKIAQGDFARTQNGVANSMRVAQASAEDAAASLGQSLLPVVADLLQTAAHLAQVFAGLPAPVRTAIVALMAIAAVAGPIVLVIGKLQAMRLAMLQNKAASDALGASMGRSAGIAAKLFGAATVATAGAAFFDAQHKSGAQSWIGERVGDIDTTDSASVSAGLARSRSLLAELEQKEGKGRWWTAPKSPLLGPFSGYTQFGFDKGDRERQDRIDALRKNVSDLERAEKGLTQADKLAKATLGDTGPIEEMATAADKLKEALGQVDDAYQQFVGNFLGADSAQFAFIEQMNTMKEGMKNGWDLEDQKNLVDTVNAAYAQAAAEANAGLIKPEETGKRALGLLSDLNGTILPQGQAQLDSYLARLAQFDQTVTTTLKVNVVGIEAVQAAGATIAGIIGGLMGGNAVRGQHPASTPVTHSTSGIAGASNPYTNPSNWGRGFGDTVSQRGRGGLAATMAAHRAISASLGIGPSITNIGLGAWPGSDHHFGRALDLQGPNLSAYAARVRAMGGFAEMHGAGNGRHLHAVPAGDTASSRWSAGSGQGGAPVIVNIDARGSVTPPGQLRAAARAAIREARREEERRR